MRELWEFPNLTKSEFELVFAGWQIHFIKIMNDVARPGLSIGYDE